MSTIRAWLFALGAGAVALLAGIALLARSRARHAQAEAAQAKTLAEVATAARAAMRRALEARQTVQAKHREAQRESDARLAAGRRDHLDGDW